MARRIILDPLTGSRRKQIRHRLMWMLGWVLLGMAALGGRLAYWQLLDGGFLGQAAARETGAAVTLPALQGQVLDRSGHVMATNVSTVTVVADPKLVKNPQQTATTLARALGLPRAQVLTDLTRHNQFDFVDQSVGLKAYDQVKNLRLPGISLLPTVRRYYPMGQAAAQVVGFSNLNGQGVAGVEESYARVLTGRSGQAFQMVDAYGNPLPQGSHVLRPPTAGNTLELTISGMIQHFADQALQAEIKKSRAHSGRVIVMDPNTGAILAMAQWPTFNPNHYAKYPPATWANQSVQSAYPPGSTFKIVTGTAALMTGVATPQSRFNDPGYITVTGVTFHEWNGKGFGNIGFDKALAYSSDVAFMKMGLKMGVKNLYHYIHLFRIDRPIGVDLPGETGGVILPAQNVRPVDLASMAFGQSLEASPLAIVDAASAVANGGNLMWPHVGREILAPSGRLIRRIQPRVLGRVMTPQVALEMQQAMKAVVAYGTGIPAQVPGYVLGGKTGTANIYQNGGILHHQYMGSFVGVGPFPHPRLAILVQIYRPENGQFYGDQVAAPVFQQVMAESLRYLGIPPSSTRVAATGARQPVPAVAGMSPAAATAALAGRSFSVQVLGQGSRVVATLPAAGALLPSRSTVLLLTDPAPATAPSGSTLVPDLTGLSLRAAALLLASRHLTLYPQGSGLVQRQTPKPGQVAPLDGVVQVTLG